MIKNRRLAKSISDAGWSRFRQWLEYFGDKYGKATVAVPPHYTSQICSHCGVKVQKSLSTRTHVYQCGYTEDRDVKLARSLAPAGGAGSLVNAAINILQKGLSTVGHTGTYAWGETSSSLVGAILLGYGDSMNQESPRL